jgi:lysophospholipase
VSSDALATASQAQGTTAPWTWTAAEASTAETVLLPFLVHFAAAKNDYESLRYCTDAEKTFADLHVHGRQSSSTSELPGIGGPARYGSIAGGIVNCLDPGSGRSPLHVAALNGHDKAVELLLQSGALVHLRDTLGHTALYYVSLCINYQHALFISCLGCEAGSFGSG